jgi:hypothetical protein
VNILISPSVFYYFIEKVSVLISVRK